MNPEWNIFNIFVVNELQSALLFDAQPTTRAMSTYAETPNQIANLFDTIAYSKCKCAQNI